MLGAASSTTLSLTDGTPLADGSALGGHVVQSLIGRGGMGEVYRARDPELARDVAIEILPQAYASDRDRRARFEREAMLLASLSHPNIAAVYGPERHGDITALVLEAHRVETNVQPGNPSREACAQSRTSRCSARTMCAPGSSSMSSYLSVLPHLPEPMRPVVTFAYVTGWRINSEVLPLQWRQVDLKAGEVRLDPGTTKNMEGRVFYLTTELKKLLADQRKAADRIQRRKGMIVQHVFFHDGITKAGEVAFLAGHAISPSGFYHAWCRARVKAGCPGSIPHDFRRTAIRNMVRAGVPERVAMKLSGHKTRSVFDRYNIVSDGDLRDAARRLEDHPRPATPATRSKS